MAKSRFQQEGLFTCHAGDLGSGKTYSLMVEAIDALLKGEPIFTNVAMTVKHIDKLKNVPVFDYLSEEEIFKNSAAPIERYASWSQKNNRCAIVRWVKPFDLLHPAVRCGKIIFDELGALAAARNWEDFPFGLTVKLIHLRKNHLSVDASVQDDQMADKNIRRFYSRVWFMGEHSWPLLGLIKKKARRPVLVCSLPGCTKNHAHLTEGDRPGRWPFKATFYSRYDVHPAYTTNKEKHKSQGTKRMLFRLEVAQAYQSAQSVQADAEAAWQEARNTAQKWNGRKPRRMEKEDEN